MGTASTPGDAVSATAAGKALNAMCHPTSVSTSTVEDTVSASSVPASATLVIRETTVRKVRLRVKSSKDRHNIVNQLQTCLKEVSKATLLSGVICYRCDTEMFYYKSKCQHR